MRKEAFLELLDQAGRLTPGQRIVLTERLSELDSGAGAGRELQRDNEGGAKRGLTLSPFEIEMAPLASSCSNLSIPPRSSRILLSTFGQMPSFAQTEVLSTERLHGQWPLSMNL